MIQVILALLMGLGVMFGMQALVIDLGYGMSQKAVMQNAADAGALGAGRLMAGSVALDTGNRPVYALSDNELHQRVASLAAENFTGEYLTRPYNPPTTDTTHAVRTRWLNTLTGAEFELTLAPPPSPPAWTPAAATHQIAVQYMPCPNQSAGTPNFSASSDADLVADIAAKQGIPAIRQTAALANNPGIGGAPNWSWSNPICMLRVWSRESHPPLFASAIGRTADEQELAYATVRIAPTTPPTVFSNVWPITHYDDPKKPDPACAFQIPGCDIPFWDSNGIGNFKMLVDMSRYSAIWGSGTREQLFAPSLSGTPRVSQNCSTLELFHLLPCYDPTWPGTHDKQTDMGHWLANGWNGQIYLPNEFDTKCTDKTRIVQECPNSRLETFGGDLGNNIAQPMQDYITNHPDNPTCNCATVNVFFFRYGEQNINQTSNVGTVWDGGNGNTLQRIIISKVRRFHFSRSDIEGSSVSGYFVGFYSDNPPQEGPPSNVANTVVLVD